MIFKIDKKEKDNFNRSCANFGAQCSFFTVESNPSILQVEVLDNGKEIDLFQAYAIGRDTGMQKLHSAVFK